MCQPAISALHQTPALLGMIQCRYFRRNPICRTGLQRILAGRASDWPPSAFYCPRSFFGERLPNARRSRARALLAPRTGQTVRGRVGVGVRVRVRVRVGVGWGLSRYLGQKCAKTSCKSSLQARPANRGSHTLGWFQSCQAFSPALYRQVALFNRHSSRKTPTISRSFEADRPPVCMTCTVSKILVGGEICVTRLSCAHVFSKGGFRRVGSE